MSAKKISFLIRISCVRFSMVINNREMKKTDHDILKFNIKRTFKCTCSLKMRRYIDWFAHDFVSKRNDLHHISPSDSYSLNGAFWKLVHWSLTRKTERNFYTKNPCCCFRVERFVYVFHYSPRGNGV